MLKIPFAKVDCSSNESEYVKEVLNSGWLTTASKAHAFEERFRERVGARFACAVNSCTAGLHLALEAVGVGPGDQVLVPSMTFTASAEVVRYLGADPVFVDCEPGTCCISERLIREAIDRWKLETQIKAVIPVHYGGHACEMDGILELSDEYGLKVVEDAAHAFPAFCLAQRRKGAKIEKQNSERQEPSDKRQELIRRAIGSIGDVTCFSFYANKTITTGEGGMLCTDDEEIAKRVKVMRLHGINRDIWDRYTTGASWEYDVVAPGFKYNMPDVAAAIGLAQLERADFFRDERERCARYYFEHLIDLECINLPVIRIPMEDHAWHLFVIVLNEQSPVPRNRFIELMNERGIGTSVHYKPLHRMTYYRECYGLKPEDFPNAEKIWKGCVSLPIYPSLTEEDLAYVVRSIKQILR